MARFCCSSRRTRSARAFVSEIICLSEIRSMPWILPCAPNFDFRTQSGGWTTPSHFHVDECAQLAYTTPLRQRQATGSAFSGAGAPSFRDLAKGWVFRFSPRNPSPKYLSTDGVGIGRGGGDRKYENRAVSTSYEERGGTQSNQKKGRGI
jgi:hypothetical protein